MSPLLIAVALGAIAANTGLIHPVLSPGLAVAAKPLLRVGVALLGFQLVFADVLGLGVTAMLVVVAVVAVGLIATMVAGKYLGLTWAQRVLIACGFSICGAAAVAAAGSVVSADEEETVTAVALVVVFGTAMIFAIPLLTSILGFDDDRAGLLAGASIHEVAQVVAAGGVIGGTALTVAVVAKLARVALLAPVVVVLSLVQRRRTTSSPQARRPPVVPLFLFGFVICAGLRSLDVVPESVLTVTSTLQLVLLTAAMFALGAGVRIAMLRAVGFRPIALGAVSTVVVTSIALGGVLMS